MLGGCAWEVWARSPPPMGFYIGILIKSSPPKGGVHKLMIFLRDLPKEFLIKFFGEEMGGSGGPRPPREISQPGGGPSGPSLGAPHRSMAK